jgi:hypothetical protein
MATSDAEILELYRISLTNAGTQLELAEILMEFSFGANINEISGPGFAQPPDTQVLYTSYSIIKKPLKLIRGFKNRLILQRGLRICGTCRPGTGWLLFL